MPLAAVTGVPEVHAALSRAKQREDVERLAYNKVGWGDAENDRINKWVCHVKFPIYCNQVEGKTKRP